MAGCGQCPDQCSCVIVNEDGEQYPGAGTSDNPIVIPEALNTPWVGTSSDNSITITPGDVVDADNDGHAPDLVVNFCEVVNDADLDSGDILVVSDDDEDCRPHRLRDPLPGEVLARVEPGKAGWVGGVASFGGDMPYGVPLEFWGSESSVPPGYELADYGLALIADNPNLFAAIGFNASGGVPPVDGVSFHKPDKRGVVAAGRDNMGGTARNLVTDPLADTLGSVLGVEAAALTAAQMVAHTHTVTTSTNGTGVAVVAGPSAVSIANAGTGVSVVAGGTGISIPVGGSHNHDGAGANHDFIVENGPTFVYLDVAFVNNDQPGTFRMTSNGFEGGNSYKPNREPLASGTLSGHAHSVSDPTHGHGISDPTHGHTVTNGAHGHTISDPGHFHTGTAAANPAHVAAPVSRLQPTVFVNYIIRMG